MAMQIDELDDKECRHLHRNGVPQKDQNSDKFFVVKSGRKKKDAACPLFCGVYPARCIMFPLHNRAVAPHAGGKNPLPMWLSSPLKALY
uniref:Uncharacterized protein n=1 Tax=Romanomermis culicivorax TaxID=13658 RepID=A0A915I6H9_ROMCU